MTNIELAESVTLNEYVQPVWLPGPTATSDFHVVLFGWSRVTTDGPPYRILKQVQMAAVACLGGSGT